MSDLLSTISTAQGVNPLEVLEQFGDSSITLVAIAVEGTHARSRQQEEKGEWIQSLWLLTLNELPTLQGCRLSWDTLFFADAFENDVVVLKEKFKRVLAFVSSPALESRCILSQASGSPHGKLTLLDAMIGEVSCRPDFGSNRNFDYRLLDGMEWNSTG